MLLKKKKRGELMKLKNILILILCIVLCPPIVMAVSDNTVYTEFTGETVRAQEAEQNNRLIICLRTH